MHPSDRRPLARVESEIMRAALAAYEGQDKLEYPLLDYRRLSHAVRAALDTSEAIFRRRLVRGMVSEPAPRPGAPEGARCRTPG